MEGYFHNRLSGVAPAFITQHICFPRSVLITIAQILSYPEKPPDQKAILTHLQSYATNARH